jgi:hypothetical protein
MERGQSLKKNIQEKIILIRNQPKWVHSIVIAICLFICLIIGTFTGKTELVFLLNSTKGTIGQVFWKDSNQDFDNSRVQQLNINTNAYKTIRVTLPGKIDQTYSFNLSFGSEANNSIIIHYLLLKKRGFKPIAIDLKKICPNQGVSDLQLTNVLRFTTNNNSPMLSFEKPNEKFITDWLLIAGYLLISITISFAALYSFTFFKKSIFNLRTVVLVSFFSIITVLGFLMAVKAGFNASPDECDHFMTAEYYKTHTETPVRNSELGVYTYNDLWAYSRVYLKGADYLLAGKFSNLFDHTIESYKSVRLFGILMLAFFALISILFSKQNLILLPILMTPQVWYLFSYVNDSSFPIFLSFLLLVLTEGFKDKLIEPKINFGNIAGILIVGFLFGILALSKENYLVFVLFFIFYLFTLPMEFNGDFKSVIQNYFLSLKRHIKTPLLIIGLAILVVGVREFSIEKQKDKSLSTETAQYYKQSKVNFENHVASGISGKARFGSYQKMIIPWTLTSGRSFISSYGYMKYWGSNLYYWINYALFFLIISGFLIFVIKNYKLETTLWAIVSLLFILVMIYASSYLYSYKYDYQAQGRYLFPVLPIVGFLIYKVKLTSGERFINSVVLPLSAILFVLGVYSFICIGLASI